LALSVADGTDPHQVAKSLDLANFNLDSTMAPTADLVVQDGDRMALDPKAPGIRLGNPSGQRVPMTDLPA
jgi:hypothetical protein